MGKNELTLNKLIQFLFTLLLVGGISIVLILAIGATNTHYLSRDDIFYVNSEIVFD